MLVFVYNVECFVVCNGPESVAEPFVEHLQYQKAKKLILIWNNYIVQDLLGYMHDLGRNAFDTHLSIFRSTASPTRSNSF